MKVKELYLLGIVIAGVIFGAGFALTGYCPGTALEACAEGKPDAWVTVMEVRPNVSRNRPLPLRSTRTASSGFRQLFAAG